MRGLSPDDYKPRQMTYDLRRLRLRALIERIPRSQRYRLTAEGLCISLAYHRTQARVLGPVLSATLDGESTTRLHEAAATYDQELGHLWEGQALAAWSGKHNCLWTGRSQTSLNCEDGPCSKSLHTLSIVSSHLMPQHPHRRA